MQRLGVGDELAHELGGTVDHAEPLHGAESCVVRDSYTFRHIFIMTICLFGDTRVYSVGSGRLRRVCTHFGLRVGRARYGERRKPNALTLSCVR